MQRMKLFRSLTIEQEKNLREKYSEIPWNDVIGMRNRLVHGYFDIDLDRVWDTITEDLPPLIDELKQLIEKVKS